MERERSDDRRRPAGFTLIELIAVMTILGLLAALVVGGATFAIRRAQEARTQALLERLALAIQSYQQEVGTYPFDAFADGGKRVDPAEALYYFLTEYPRQTRRDPFLELEEAHLADVDRDGLGEIVDSWGRPVIYKRARGFQHPSLQSQYFNSFQHPAAGDARRTDVPWHHHDAYDLFSMGRNGTTRRGPGAAELWEKGGADLGFGGGSPTANYYLNPLSTPYGGEDGDDINNWQQ